MSGPPPDAFPKQQIHIVHIAGESGFYKDPPYNKPIVLMPGSRGRAEEISRLLENPELVKAPRTEHDAWFGHYREVPVLSISSGMGPSSTAIIAQELVAAGIKRIIRVGTSGSFQRRVGDLQVGTGAIPDEDVSEKYMPLNHASIPPYQEVHEQCREILSELGIPTSQLFDTTYSEHTTYSEPAKPILPSHPDSVKALFAAAKELSLEEKVFAGLFHTKSALIREQKIGHRQEENAAYIKNLTSAGVLASEMELSVLNVLQYALGKPLKTGGICVSISNNVDGVHHPYMPYEQWEEGERQMIKLALEAAHQWALIDGRVQRA